MARKKIAIVFIAAIVLFLVIQIIPVGSGHSNPPVKAEPKWDSPKTRELVKRACFDCHSNETVWPWYSYVAPVSWLVIQDADEGRSVMNFSEWTPGMNEMKEDITREVKSGRMPPSQYTLLHPNAVLSAEEKSMFLDGIQKTMQ